MCIRDSNITNNTVTGDYLTATTGAFYGIYSTATAATVNINNNTVQNLSYSAATLTGTGAVYPIWNSGAATTVNANNNTVNNITRTGTTGGTTIGIYISGGATQNANGNTISNMSISGSGTASTMYGIQTTTGTITVNNNNISNLQCIKTSGTGALYGICNFASPTNETINNNNVNNLTHNGTGIVYGIYHITITGTRTMSGNTVHTITGAGTTIAGINNASSSPSVFRNNVYNISSTSTGTPTVSGIIQGSLGTSGVAYIYNNFVSDIKAPNASNATAAVRGINITTTTASTNIYLFYNTVYLDASSSGANFGTAALFVTASATATTANLTMRNNIFVNNSTANGSGFTVAYQRSTTDLANYNSASNNNLFFAGTPSATNLIFNDGTNSDQTIAAFKTRVAPRDAQSFTENPPFVNVSTTPYNLHLQTTVATQCESGGQRITSPIAITNDFDDDLRWGETGYSGTGTAVDVGADEFNGTPLDLSPPVITYTLLSNSASLTTRTLTNFATITDASGVNTTSNKPRLYFKKSTDNNTYVDNTSATNGWKYAEASNASSPFSFTIDYSIINGGSVAVGDVIQYFVVAQDLASTPNVGINSGTFAATPSSVALTAAAFPIGGTINSYTIAAGISGAVTVGTGGTYSTLTGAGGLFADINNKVVTGNITATIISDLSEDGTNALNQMAVEGGNWTLTIQPDAATVRNITGNFAGGLIRLNGADRVTIDGRYNLSGYYLTISNTATTGTIATIQLISLGPGQGCEDVTIRNCNISTGFNGATSYGIFAGGNGIGNAGDDHDNLTITENNIFKANYGLRIMSSSAGKSDNVAVTKNSIGSNTVADYIGKYGMEFIQIDNATIAENTIFNIKTTNTNLFGISIGSGVTNTTISRNLIYGLNYTGTAGYGGKGIDINTGVASSNLTVANNVIYDIGGDGWSVLTTDANVGIRILGTSGGINIYYNSVNLYGTWNRSTATLSAALYVPSGVTNINVRNNVFSNSIVNTSNTGAKAYAIYNAGTNGVFSQINYNDYFASGTQGVLGYLTSDRTTLSDWQTATGQDAYSYSADPAFTANDNLLPDNTNANCWNLNGKGVPISGISTDFAGTPRSTSVTGGPTDIGAYEFSTSTTPPVATASAAPALNTTTTYTYAGRTLASITWGNTGTVPSSVDVRYYSGSNPPGSLSGKYSRAYWEITVPDGSGYTYDITLNYDPATIYTITNENDIRIAKRDGGPWTHIAGSTVNTTNKTVTATGLTSFSDFALSDNSDPLPVQLSSFTASVSNRDIALNWKTETEVNSAKFVVERKHKDNEWTSIAEVKASGNSNSPKEYSYLDKKLNSGVYEYRLKMIDNDGTYSYSDVVEGNVDLPKEYGISQNYPNPFNPTTKIDYQLPFDSKVMVELYSITGEKVGELFNGLNEAGYYTLEVNGSSLRLASGVYIYRILATNLTNGQVYMNVKKMMMIK